MQLISKGDGVKKIMVVGVDNFSSRLSGFEQWVRGQVVSVSDEDAEHYLGMTYTDALNNEHVMFTEVDTDTPLGVSEEEVEKPKIIAKRQRRAA